MILQHWPGLSAVTSSRKSSENTASCLAIWSFYFWLQTSRKCTHPLSSKALAFERPLKASLICTWFKGVNFMAPRGTEKQARSISVTVAANLSNSVRCFGGKMIPAAASITWGGSLDSIRTVSNSPLNRVPNSMSYLAWSALTVGRLEKTKFWLEHQ